MKESVSPDGFRAQAVVFAFSISRTSLCQKSLFWICSLLHHALARLSAVQGTALRQRFPGLFFPFRASALMAFLSLHLAPLY